MKISDYSSEPDLYELAYRLIQGSECPQVDLIQWAYEPADPQQRISRAEAAKAAWKTLLKRRQKPTCRRQVTDSGVRYALTWSDYEQDLGAVIDEARKEQGEEKEENSAQSPSPSGAVPRFAPSTAPLLPKQGRASECRLVILGCAAPAAAPREPRSYPLERDYAGVLVWIRKEKAEGTDWYAEAGCNRSRMCRRLSDVFGWIVSENSLRKAETRDC